MKKSGNRSAKRGRRKEAAVDAEEAWANITLNPPPMPPAQKTISPMEKTAPKKAKNPHKKPQDPAKNDTHSDRKLKWRDVALPSHISSADNELGGVVSLQEIDGVDCILNDNKAPVFKQRQNSSSKKRKRHAEATSIPNVQDESEDESVEDVDMDNVNWDEFVLVDDFTEEKAEKGELKSIGALMRDAQPDSENSDDDQMCQESVPPVADSKASAVDVSAWTQLELHPDLLRALQQLEFTKPTEIQAKTLPQAMSGHDIIGAAETGSGKTLAFGIPMLQHLSAHPSAWTGPTGLVLTPTRELAIQVKDHLVAMAQFSRARIISIVGGMSQAKQERLLNSKPDIIVATPGRLWELASTNDAYLNQLKSIRFLAVDEADRMLEPGHFKELKFIFKTLNEKTVQTQGSKRQTFVFSATLLKDMQLVARRQSSKTAKRNRGQPEPGSMEDLIERVGFQDAEPAFVDVTQATATAQTLVETRIDCLANEKDYYLYYFLIRYPARTLVFVNSIDSIRRMLPMLRLLRVNVFGLHAQMEQRQRLKNIDRFRDTENAVLVASDVAARGLDIPKVEYVIHYQMPRSGDLYVHRSGRTARAQNEGLAVMLVSPEERKLYYKMCAKLDKNIAPFPVDLDLIGRIKPRVDLARDVELREHRLNKAAHERNWFRKNAEELDIELDSDFMPSSDDERSAEAEHGNRHERQQIKGLKAQLSQMLNTKIFSRGTSGRYLSGGIISDLAERLLDQSSNANIPTLSKESAIETAKAKAGKRG
ncbi:ATP-dependent RNA helicase [Coemansia sp. RSA 1821]|nr:ATP-dependent RNA helicase [Coemansia sp. RSA 1821]